MELNHVPLKVQSVDCDDLQSLSESTFGLVDSYMPVYQHSINAMVMPPYLNSRSPCRSEGRA